MWAQPQLRTVASPVLFYCRRRGYWAHVDAIRCASSDFRAARVERFAAEKLRQSANVGLIEKIKITVKLPQDDVVLIMNKNISTPYDCAKHIDASQLEHAAVALVGAKPWDMHRPLEDDAELKFLHFTDADTKVVNKVYWRSCSYILGYALETSFKESVRVLLHSWPAVDYAKGCFVYDAMLDLKDWRPTKEELNIIGRRTSQALKRAELFFEPLVVDASVAKEIFRDNPFKLEQIDSVAESYERPGKVPLFRLGDHVDISIGPMISSTKQLGYFAVTNIYPVETSAHGQLYRAQGISIPFTQKINSWTWEVLCKASAKPVDLPGPDARRKQIEEGRRAQASAA